MKMRGKKKIEWAFAGRYQPGTESIFIGKKLLCDRTEVREG